MNCAELGKNGERSKLDFRLTIGLRKIEGKWTIVHEHHSVPAT
jgi:ketosteroid isomerase-like protein